MPLRQLLETGCGRCRIPAPYAIGSGNKLRTWVSNAPITRERPGSTGLVLAYKRLEEHVFTWPAIRDGVVALNHAQFEALFSDLDWRTVRAVAARPPTAAEWITGSFWRVHARRF
ncbi:IS66 family insertion sequence element accessory protein TnpB [Puniceibacterium sediminis]|uniref:IS66 family insertion sequence element accessory protein TnpB n=1 Tax=Puniceibacterium sediminis TaxID=1608407 RepID=UPI003CCBE1E9